MFVVEKWFLRPVHLVHGSTLEGSLKIGCRLTYTVGGWQQLVMCGAHTRCSWCSEDGAANTMGFEHFILGGGKPKLNCCIGIYSLMVLWVYKDVNSDLEIPSCKSKSRWPQLSVDIDRHVSLQTFLVQFFSFHFFSVDLI